MPGSTIVYVLEKRRGGLERLVSASKILRVNINTSLTNFKDY